jgi:glycosyltransferase involved in cell wall biosynthesis
MTRWVILALASAILLVWIMRNLMLTQTLRTQALLRPGAAGPLPAEPPPATIVVPARDEAGNIAACLATLQAQDYPNFEIIVVDDRSRDHTAEIVRGLAAADPRIRLVQVTELPSGWFGKPHAMTAGAHEARGDWLLFVDADCRQDPGSLRAAVAHALAEKADMLSLWPLLEMHGLGENLVLPLCGSILALYFRPQWVNNPRRKTAFANGQYILIRRAVYEAVGGHEPVRGAIVEDIAFARLVKGAGYRLRNAIGLDLFKTRMYDSFAAAWRGWTRIFSGAFASPWFIPPIIVLMLLLGGSPYVLTVAAGLLAGRAGWADPMLNALFALGLAQLAAMFTVLVRYNRMARSNPAYLALYPVSILAVTGILLSAFFARLGLKKIYWRGTAYRGSAKR